MGAWGTAARSGNSNERESCAPRRGRLQDIATELGVSKSSVSSGSATSSSHRTHAAARAAAAAAAACTSARWRRSSDSTPRASTTIGQLTEREFLILGVALYAGEGSKTRRRRRLAPTPTRTILVLSSLGCAVSSRSTSPGCGCASTSIEGLDLDAAEQFWRELTADPCEPVPEAVSRRRRPDVAARPSTSSAARPSSTAHRPLHRRVMGMVAGAIVDQLPFRGSSVGRAPDC